MRFSGESRRRIRGCRGGSAWPSWEWIRLAELRWIRLAELEVEPLGRTGVDPLR